MQRTMLLLVASLSMCLGIRTVIEQAPEQTPVQTPIGKAVELLNTMDAKIKAAGEAAQVSNENKTAYCKDRSKDLGFEITTAGSAINRSAAEIEDETAKIEKLTLNIDDGTKSISENGANLANATVIRESEGVLFKKEETELVDIIDTLQRAIGILNKEAATKGASFVQGLATTPVLQAMDSLVKGSVLSAADASRLSALVQSGRAEEDADDSEFGSELGAPEAAVYESSSGGIIKTLENLLDSAQDQLLEARRTEANRQHSFDMLKQSLEMEIASTKAGLKEYGGRLVASKKEKQDAEEDLAQAEKVLAAAEADLTALTKACDEAQKNYDAEVQSRKEELGAIASALKALNDMTDSATALTYSFGQTSFVQRSQLSSDADLAGFEVSRLVRDLAKKEGTPELARLASRVAFLVQEGARSGGDPFAKVKALISGLIDKLKAEADAEATEKERCDRELADSRAKAEEKTAVVNKLTADINRWSAASSKLKEEIAVNQASISKLATEQAELDKMCKAQADEYTQGKKDMEMGLQGVGLALRSLRDYYARLDTNHETSEGSASGIIGMLEVVHSDFTQNLATIEENAAKLEASCMAETQENAIENLTLTQDVKYKTKESARLDKLVDDASVDLEDEQSQLDATTQFLKATEEACADKAMTYEERTSRREREIAGLKEALSVLESETVLVQHRSRRAKGSYRLQFPN